MKKWLWLLIVACLPFPALSQTRERQDPEITAAYSEAYTRFFAVVWNLMERDRGQSRFFVDLSGPIGPPELRLRGKVNNLADHWLTQRLFSTSDIAQVKNVVSQWYTDQHVVPFRQKVPDAVPDYSIKVDQRYSRIALDAGTKLESQLEGRKHFHEMIRDCARRMRFGPEYDESGCFAPPKPRLT